MEASLGLVAEPSSANFLLIRKSICRVAERQKGAALKTAPLCPADPHADEPIS
jgi:hypothetical protein